jgi:hypothetical protein
MSSSKFETIESSIEGRWVCPVVSCKTSYGPTHYNLLVKHCLEKYQIVLQKVKVKKESTIKKEQQIEARKTKKLKYLETCTRLSVRELLKVTKWKK